MSAGLLSSLIDELVTLFEPLAAAADDPWVLDSLLEALDADDPRLTGGLVEGLRRLGQGIAGLKSLQASSDSSLQSVGAALDAARDLSAAAQALGQVSASAYPALGADLIHLLVLTRLRLASPLVYQLAAMIGLVEYQVLPPIRINGELVRHPQPVERLMFDRIGTLFTDPLRFIREQLPSPPLATVANAEQTADILVNRIGGVLNALGVPWVYGYPAGDERFLGESAEQAAHTLVIYLPTAIAGDDVTAGVCINLSSADADDFGVVLTPFGALTLQGTFGRWSVGLELAADVQALAFGGGQGVRILASAATTSINAIIKAALPPAAPGTPAAVIGSAGGTRLEVGAPQFSATLRAAQSGIEVVLSADTGKSALVVHPGDGDGFLSSFLPAEGMRADFDLGLAWSNERGLTLSGSAGLEATFPVSVSVGGVTFSAIHVSLQASESGVTAEVSATLGASIGPVRAAIERMGIAGALTFPEAGGNLGVADLDLRFKPPKGVGLSLEAGFVKGGGYFFTDPANHEYAGALELQLGKIGVKAIGALTTRPDGWSLILLVYGQFPPIQLSFGFTLNGIGGMIGVQHGVDVTQLILGMQTKAFDDILFPENPVADAPRILNRLRALFPIAPRSLTLGPMVDIGWGTPRIVFIRLGILFQLDNVFGSAPGPVSFTRVVLIGQLRVAIGPTKEDAEVTVVKLVVDILGFWEFDKKRYGFLARLRDSSIAKVDIVGGLGVWGEYGDHPRFLLAAGGFNARFKDVPTDMSGAIDRLGAAFKVGRFSLTLTGYFALTPATLQAGLDLAATAQLGPVGVKGTIGFDVLIYREPDTHFIADFHIIAEVTYRGHSLAGVKVIGTVEGPGLWHVVGELSFSILWWDIGKSFDESWGSAPSLSSVQTDVQALLTAELAKRENWSAQLPAGADAMVTLAPHMGELAPLAHPLGRFVFSQCVTPLGLTLERYGSTRISGRNRFDLSSVTAGGQAITARTPVREHFARAQFIETTEEEKLTRPSFEEMDSGVEFSSEAYRVSANAVAADMDYETAYLDIDPQGSNRTRRDPALSRVALDHGLIRALAMQGAAARAPQRGRERMRARTQVRVAVSAAPLTAADRSAFAADSAVPMSGQARTVEMIAEQRFKPKDAARSQLIEEFELAGG